MNKYCIRITKRANNTNESTTGVLRITIKMDLSTLKSHFKNVGQFLMHGWKRKSTKSTHFHEAATVPLEVNQSALQKVAEIWKMIIRWIEKNIEFSLSARERHKSINFGVAVENARVKEEIVFASENSWQYWKKSWCKQRKSWSVGKTWRVRMISRARKISRVGKN